MTSVADFAGEPGHYLVALDTTGLTEIPLPREFVGLLPHLIESPYWKQGFGPHELVATRDQNVLIEAFAEARETGYSACLAHTANEQTLTIRFFDQIARHGAVVVVVGEGTAVPSSVDAQPGPVPLRMVHEVSLFGLTTRIDAATRDLLGWGDEVIGKSRVPLGHPDEVARMLSFWRLVVSDPTRSHRTRGRMRTASGQYRWFDSTVAARPSGSDVVEIELIDVTEHLAATRPTHAMSALVEMLANLSSVALIVIDAAGRTVTANDLFEQLVGDTELLGHLKLRESDVPLRAHELIEIASDHKSDETKVWRVAIAGRDRVLHGGAQVLHGDEGGPFVVIAVDPQRNVSPRQLPKGLSTATMSSVLEYMGDAEGGVSYDQVANGVGVSDATARRYLTYLVESGRAVVSPGYGSVGRPRHYYVLLD